MNYPMTCFFLKKSSKQISKSPLRNKSTKVSTANAGRLDKQQRVHRTIQKAKIRLFFFPKKSLIQLIARFYCTIVCSDLLFCLKLVQIECQYTRKLQRKEVGLEKYCGRSRTVNCNLGSALTQPIT